MIIKRVYSVIKCVRDCNVFSLCAPGGAPVCVRSISEGLCVRCVMLSVCLMMSVCFVMLCAWKASVYLSKRINSSLLTKIFNGIR